MSGIRFKPTGGVAPRVGARDLPNHMAQTALNCDLRRGDLRPMKGTTFVWTPTKVGTILAIYRWGGAFWFHWTTDVDVVRGPIAGDTTERTYWTGDGYPKVTDSSIATSGGGTNYPNNSYRMGIPAPATAPTVSAGAGGGCATEDQISAVFVYTYVSGWGEEGPPSAPSASVDVCHLQSVTVDNMTAPTGPYNITHKRIYCAIDGETYQYVGEVAVGIASLTFAFDQEALGEPCPSVTWIMPPDNMQGLCMLPNGIPAGFAGNELMFGEPWIPSAFPVGYRLTTDFPIVGIKPLGQGLVVGTTGIPYVVRGADPSAMDMDKLKSNQACVSKRGMVDMGYMVAYPSPDGLVGVTADGDVRVLTEKWLTREQWQAYVPSSIHAYYWEGVYLGFYNTGSVTGGFIFDPAGEGLKHISTYATAGFNALEEDALYLVVGGNIVKWNAGADQSYTWKSKKFEVPKPVNFGAGQVNAEAYPVTLKVYGDGTLRATKTVANGDTFRLPGKYQADKWEFQIEGTAPVSEVVVAETPKELANV